MRIALAVASFLVTLQASSAAQPSEVAPGTLVEKVTCAEDASHSYALYVPASYDPSKRWPVLYVLDPRGRAKLAAEVFRAGAERFGYLLVSSYESASDTPDDRNTPAMQAMWRDVHAYLSLDDRRAYAAGFSGTARGAFHMGMAAPGSFAGIIAAGGGFPPDEPPRGSATFAVFATAGVLDFNYYEMVELEGKLTALGIRNRLETFDGRHQWPPVEVAERAIAWMEIQAMRSRVREKNSALVEEIWSSEIARAKQLRSDGALADSSRLYHALASDFRGLRDVSAAESAAAELEKDRGMLKETARRRARNDRDQAYLRSAASTFSKIRQQVPMPAAGSLASELEIDRLLRTASGHDVEEARSARRRLNNILVYAAFYMPRRLLEEKQYDRAIVSLGIAKRIEPDDPDIEYDLARCYAGKRDRKQVLSHLDAAHTLGLESEDGPLEAEFAWLRGDEDFERLIGASGK